jgi:methionyl-tRNA formyltransferase
MKVLIANSNPIHQPIEKKCKDAFDAVCISSKNDLSKEKLELLAPDFIFFLHWSFIIPESVFKNFNCVLFHMTDLPYGRGGSPLQNLIVLGHTETMISGIRVEQGIDEGAVYLKKKLSLEGTAEEIFLRAGKVMFEMIREIIDKQLKPIPQEGEITFFKRRTPADSNIGSLADIETTYDFIRMLDADGYPKAFLETQFLRFEFTRATHRGDGIIADVKITKK